MRCFVSLKSLPLRKQRSLRQLTFSLRKSGVHFSLNMSKVDEQREPLLQSPQQATMGEAGDGDRCCSLPQNSSLARIVNQTAIQILQSSSAGLDLWRGYRECRVRCLGRHYLAGLSLSVFLLLSHLLFEL